MDIIAIIKELRSELERIDALILALDRLQSGRRRGRPPKLLQELRAGATPGSMKTSKRASAKKGAKKKSKRGRHGKQPLSGASA
jgi:hypothetical protein